MDLGRLRRELLRRQEAAAAYVATPAMVPITQNLPFDVLCAIIAACAEDKKTLNAIALTCKDCSHEANKYLWARMRIRSDTLLGSTAIAQRMAADPQRALCIKYLRIAIPAFKTPQPAFIHDADADDGEDSKEEWSAKSLRDTLDACCSVLKYTHHLRTLVIEADAFFVETARAFSSLARDPDATSFRLRRLSTNLFAADGLLSFLAAHPEIEELTQHWRRDRWLNEPGSLTPRRRSSPRASPSPNSSPTPSLHGDTTILPNLWHLEHGPRGMEELTRGRPVGSISTTLRDVRDLAELVNAMQASAARITHLKVNVEAAEVLRPFLETLSLPYHNHGGAAATDRTTSSTSSGAQADGGDGPGKWIEMMSITLQAHHDISPYPNRGDASAAAKDILSNLRHGFSRMHTLRWSAALAPKAVFNPSEYAGPALRCVKIETMGIPGSEYIRVDDEDGLGGSSWKLIPAKPLPVDGRRRRELFERIGSHDVEDVE